MKQLIISFFFSLILFCSNNVYSQMSNIQGKVIDSKTKDIIIGASVIIKGTTTGAVTDLNGEFHINNVEHGSYTLVISFMSYSTIEIPEVRVRSEENDAIQVELEETVFEIKGVTVVGQKKTDTEISMINTIKTSELQLNGVSSQQISKTQDRSAADVVKRVPGVTIIDNRFIIIRGLNERYNSVLLNMANAPSAEADVKAFSFDFIPSSLIDNILIYKTAAPELPGDFAGGAIQIFTKNAPEKNSLIISYSNSFYEGTSFQTFNSYNIGRNEFLGFDGAVRNLPDAFPENIASIPNTEAGKDLKTEWGRAMNKVWTPNVFTAPTDQRFSIALTRRIQTKTSAIITNVSSLNYSNTFANENIFRAAYNTYDEINDKSDTSYYFNDSQYTNKIKVGALFNWSYITAKSKIEFRNLYNHIANNRVTMRTGRDNYGGMDLWGEELAYITRSIYSGQFSGRHRLRNENAKFDWVLGYSYTDKNQPDTKRLTASRNEDEESPYYGMYGLNFSFSANPALSGRIFQNMQENIYMGAGNYSQKMFWGDFHPELKTGFYIERKDRVFSARNLGYKIARTSMFDWSLPYLAIDSVFSNQYINCTDGIMLDETTNPSDAYTAGFNIYASYFAINLPISNRFKIYTGFRIENSTMTLNSYQSDASNPPLEEDAVKYISDTTLLLPSINMTYSIGERSYLRFAYGKTVNRPEFREVAPFSFYDYELKAVISGNDTLDFASIHNFDLRYEFYPRYNEMITIGVFYKDFTNPIEYKIIPTGSGLQYSFQNTNRAISYGAEIEMRKSLENLKDKSSFLNIFSNFSLIMNLTLINSQIYFGDESLEQDRPMQGQSPYIVNTGVFYRNDTLGLSASLMYNVIGERIVFAGDPYTGNPSVFEMPRNLLDFALTKSFGDHFSVKLGVQNILSSRITYRQTVDVNIDGEDLTRTQDLLDYKTGRYYSFGITYKL